MTGAPVQENSEESDANRVSHPKRRLFSRQGKQDTSNAQQTMFCQSAADLQKRPFSFRDSSAPSMGIGRVPDQTPPQTMNLHQPLAGPQLNIRALLYQNSV